jgi:hypothetical protein|tara:strand:+ start:144 stop:353 length:210 start_codon:yes stop_codon:yes gene_type:complete
MPGRQVQKKKEAKKPATRVSFTGLTMDQLAKRRGSKTKGKKSIINIKHTDRVSVMSASISNAFEQKKRS